MSSFPERATRESSAVPSQGDRPRTSQEPGVIPGTNVAGGTMDVDDDDLESRAQSQRRRRELLQQEIEIETMEQQLAALKRRRNAGSTPAPSYDDLSDDGRSMSLASSARSAQAERSGLANRPQMRKPEVFRGKTLKEAREFIHTLELVFALAPSAYSSDRNRVLYGVMFLASAPRETWGHSHSVADLGGYTWEDFKKFVVDTVEDPVNRSLSTTVAYETARQGDSQTAQAFATELATLEEQMDPYTPEQRTRHLLAKLKPALRTLIVTHHEVPKRREDLVSLATRLESAGTRADVTHEFRPKRDSDLQTKRDSDSQSKRNANKRRRGSPPRNARPAPSHGKPMRDESVGDWKLKATCRLCNRVGHIQRDCPEKATSTTRKVTVSDKAASHKRDRLQAQ
jgi:hypothetical protein